jgi:hypothetical protein
MATGILADALREFESALDDFTGNLEFIRAAKQLRPRLKDMLSWATMDGEAKKLATTFMRQRNAEESVLYRGMVVSLSGAFEQFVRRVLRDSVIAVNVTGANYDRVHEGIRRQNVYRTGLALQTIFEPLDYLELDYEVLAKNLGTCFLGSERPVLNADAFAIFLSIVSPDKLVDALARIGIKMDWDELGSMQPIQKALEKDSTRETAKALQETLKQFGRTRNKVAHSGSGGVVVSDSDLEQLLRLFRMFSRGLCAVVQAGVAKLIPK